MNIAHGAMLRRTERWLVGLALAALVLLIERVVVRAARRREKARRSGQRRT